MGTALARFVVTGFVLYRMQLRRIMPVYALLQRMGIFGGEQEKWASRTYGCLSGLPALPLVGEILVTDTFSSEEYSDLRLEIRQKQFLAWINS